MGGGRPGATAWLTEGPFDWLALRQWGYPALCLVGTHASAPALQALQRFARVYLVLDADDAGRAATATLTRALGRRARPVPLPGVKDVAELAERPDGRTRFARALGPGRSDAAGAGARPPACVGPLLPGGAPAPRPRTLGSRHPPAVGTPRNARATPP